MAKVTVKVKFDFMQKFKGLVDQALTDQIGQMLVDESLKAISSGLSPVKGVGKFEPYKDPKKYPGKRKSATPVNLALSGEMLSYLSWKRVGQTIEFGIMNAPSKIKKMVETHNDGSHPHVPRRQFIPDFGAGEEFIASIMNKIFGLYKVRLGQIIQDSNG